MSGSRQVNVATDFFFVLVVQMLMNVPTVYVRIVEYVQIVWALTPVTVLVPGMKEQTVTQVNI